MSNNNFDCIICYETKPDSDKVLTPCAHGPLCHECLQIIIRTSGKCPCCNLHFTNEYNESSSRTPHGAPGAPSFGGFSGFGFVPPSTHQNVTHNVPGSNNNPPSFLRMLGTSQSSTSTGGFGNFGRPRNYNSNVGLTQHVSSSSGFGQPSSSSGGFGNFGRSNTTSYSTTTSSTNPGFTFTRVSSCEPRAPGAEPAISFGIQQNSNTSTCAGSGSGSGSTSRTGFTFGTPQNSSTTWTSTNTSFGTNTNPNFSFGINPVQTTGSVPMNLSIDPSGNIILPNGLTISGTSPFNSSVLGFVRDIQNDINNQVNSSFHSQTTNTIPNTQNLTGMPQQFTQPFFHPVFARQTVPTFNQTVPTFNQTVPTFNQTSSPSPSPTITGNQNYIIESTNDGFRIRYTNQQTQQTENIPVNNSNNLNNNFNNQHSQNTTNTQSNTVTHEPVENQQTSYNNGINQTMNIEPRTEPITNIQNLLTYLNLPEHNEVNRNNSNGFYSCDICRNTVTCANCRNYSNISTQLNNLVNSLNQN